MKRLIYCILMSLLLPGLSLNGQDCLPRSSLPTFCITTGGAPINSKENYVTGNLRIIQEGSAELYAGDIRIRGRGNSTWMMDKKPYRINLNVASSLLGMPATARNWVLLANHADKTLIRNAVALDVSRYVGMPYASPFRFVDVVINGEYKGSYLLTDHMEVRENRVDIEEGQDEDVPGAYLVELDGFAWQEPPYFQTSQELIGSIKYPDVESEDDPRIQEITDHLNSFEERLFSDIPATDPGGYFEKVDRNSLINWYLTCEIVGNSDSFWSVYLHKRRSDDRIFFGPHWDFDIAFDNDQRIRNARYRLMADVGHGDIFRRWITRLRQDDIFMRAVRERWNELKRGGLREFMLAKVDEYSQLLTSSGSQAENFSRWPVLDTRVYLEVKSRGSYQEHVDFLRQYISDRIDWLDLEFNGLSSDYNYRLVNVHSQRALRVSDGEIRQQTFQEVPEYLWQIRSLPNGFFQLLNTSENKALTWPEKPGDAVFLSDSDPENPRQQWRITRTSDREYAIISRNGRLGLQNRSGATGNSPIHAVDVFAYDTEKQAEIRGWLDDVVAGKWRIEPVGTVLPDRIIHFSGAFTEGNVHLAWQLSGVQDGSYFSIERYGAGKKTTEIGQLSVRKGNEEGYTWVDRNPLPGYNHYRIRLIHKDGTLLSESNIVSLMNEEQGLSAYVYPNPVSGPFTIRFESDSEGEILYELYNGMGLCVQKAIQSVYAGSNDILITNTRLPSGVYLLKVTRNQVTVTSRFVVN